MVTLVMTAGNYHDIRPADVVRTFTEESGIQGRDIGLITIKPRQTYIDIKDRRVAQVLQALSRFQIKGHEARLSKLERTQHR